MISGWPSTCSYWDVMRAWLLPKDDVQNESKMQDATNAIASHAVTFFKTSGVDVPNNESDVSPPPNDAPKPPPLPSCINIAIQRTKQRNKKNIIPSEYKNVITNNPCFLVSLT
jgi:hypothetical protein